MVLATSVLTLVFSFGAAQEAGKIAPDLEKLIKELHSKEVKVKIKAAKSIGDRGPEAADAATALCDSLMDSSLQVGTMSLEALEKVRPDLYKHVSTLILDKDRLKQKQAIGELGLMGDKALPVTNILLARLRTELSSTNAYRPRPVIGAAPVPANPFGAPSGLTDFEHAYLNALEQIKPSDGETIRIYKVLAGSTNKKSYVRRSALVYLNGWAGEDEPKRKEILSLLKAALPDPVCQVTCIEIVGSYGALAKDCIPLLKRLKLSNEEVVRNSASAAIDKIENP
jgi:HEAT repeat protein